MNQFGLITQSLLNNKGKSSILEQDSAIKIAKEVVLYFCEFNNVKDISSLKIINIIHSENNPDYSAWKIIFEKPILSGIRNIKYRCTSIHNRSNSGNIRPPF